MNVQDTPHDRIAPGAVDTAAPAHRFRTGRIVPVTAGGAAEGSF
ncbi:MULTISPECIES: hypothetical protein [Pseudonocardia]|uniref:Uncharacterized protein n=2 Tax=Pseudonocardia TaxID=1847 RepID=A0A1Y2N6W4_PSEAH|nr:MULTISPECIES: hypothetical protein [Pseudonocardia]OSY42837.1 hypothetical protein BG845_01078 [Pseudonocardia autotrophica]TDN77414.1 hypothetical protein C8E95_6660 [Pseudonocardia autotrophica]BBG01438.1 hypothetical protein Pdca_26470 [Pseudonocardia autotrophica]GEC24495.1 hypothetical protein PSA01_15240 [Pseudonocardia saturnea]